VRLAGELKIREAVPALTVQLKNANTKGGAVTMTREVTLEDDPPGKALAQIGESATAGIEAPFLTAKTVW
jgi:hypothetical protein